MIARFCTFENVRHDDIVCLNDLRLGFTELSFQCCRVYALNEVG